MNKSEKIREYVRAHPGCCFKDIAAGTKLRIGFVITICGQRTKAGEFVKSEAGGFTYNNDYVGRAGGRPPGGKIKGNRAIMRENRKTGKIKSMRQLVEKFKEPAKV